MSALPWREKTMIDPHDFAKKQLELTAEFGKYVFDHPEVDEQLPDGAYVYFEVAGEPEFNDYSRSLAGRQRKENGVPVVLVRIQGFGAAPGISSDRPCHRAGTCGCLILAVVQDLLNREQ